MALFALIKKDLNAENPTDPGLGMYHKVFVRYRDVVNELLKMPSKLRRSYAIQAIPGRYYLKPTMYCATLSESNTIDGEKTIVARSILYDNTNRLRFDEYGICQCSKDAKLVKIPRRGGMMRYTYIEPSKPGIFYHIRIRQYKVVGCKPFKEWSQEEDSIIKNYYPTEGACGVHKRLNGRSMAACIGRAIDLDVMHTNYML